MKKRLKLNLKTKVLIGLGIKLLAGSAILVLSLSINARVGSSALRLMEDHKYEVLSDQLVTTDADEAISIKDYMLYKDPSYIDSFNESSRKVDEILNRLISYSENDMKSLNILSQLKNYHQQYKDAVADRIIPAVRRGDIEEAIQIGQSILEIRVQTKSLILQYEESFHNELTKTSEDILKVIHHSKILTISLILLSSSIVICIAIAFILVVLKPINEMSAALEILCSSENLTQEICTDEIIRLTEAVSRLNKYVNRLHNNSIKDCLTGTYNRRFLDEYAAKTVSEAKRFQKELCVLMVDVDFFKRVNDEYSHPVGDLVLKNLAHTLQKSSRKCDLVARYGGEEFTVVLPETNIDGAVVIAEKIRKAVEKNKIFYKNEKGLNITISIGAAEFKAYENELQLFARADEALYKAKNTGRNKVVAL